MDLKEAVAAAKRQIGETFAGNAPRDLRLDGFVYDDHLMVWSLTIGFAPPGDPGTGRISKIVRVSEANKSVLSIRDA